MVARNVIGGTSLCATSVSFCTDTEDRVTLDENTAPHTDTVDTLNRRHSQSRFNPQAKLATATRGKIGRKIREVGVKSLKTTNLKTDKECIVMIILYRKCAVIG